MAITMQGSWTVTVKSKSAALAQRVVISGAASGNGDIAGVVGNSAFVTGTQWSINVQSQSPGHPWKDSRQRITFPSLTGGGSLLHFDIQSDDGGGADLDFNDLIVTCTMVTSASEFVVYGNAKTYQGFCRWNPCYPWYYVIDSPYVLAEALKSTVLRKVIERLYPERVPKPGPNPPPGPIFTPLVIPTGNPVENAGLVFRSASTLQVEPEAAIKNEKDLRKFQESAVAKLRSSAHPVSFDGSPVAAGASMLERSDLVDLAKINDARGVFRTCDVEPAGGLLLNFLEYDRTSSEKLGGVYTGGGSREILGLAATDELGNYIFRFSRSLSDIAGEALDVGAGELLATQLFPDVMVQAIGTGMQVDYESAPYYNIPNLYRIDLCLPYGTVHPSTGTCAAFDRTLVKIGDIIVLHSALGGHPNTLDATGRITCINANAPRVDCAAWRGGLRFYGCLPTDVVWYSLRYKRIGIDSSFQPVPEIHKLNHIPEFAVGYTGTVVGPFPVSVHLDGGGAVMHPVYANHQGDSNWIENDLKAILNTGLYSGPTLHGSVDFRIQGYDVSGNLVAGTDDTIRLYVDNKLSTGSINNVSAIGAVAPDDCALLTLPSASAPLTVAYRIDNPEGFLASWALSVTRGNNVSVPVTASGVMPQSFPASGLADPCQFHGSDDFALDASNFTETTLVPSPAGATWLPAGKTFCAFAFTLTANDRVTDGRNGYPQTVFWQDLVGMNS